MLCFPVYENDDKLLWKPDLVDNKHCKCIISSFIRIIFFDIDDHI